jgi:hypothetical protein
MGGLFSANTTVQANTQTLLNSITQTSAASCAATCTEVQSGNTVFLINSSAASITFNQSCTVDATCQITNSVQAAANALQKTLQSGTASSSLFSSIIGVNTNVQNANQVIQQAVTQDLDSTCSNGASQVQDANLVYAQDSSTGAIAFNQNSNVTSQCVLSNLAKGTASATQQADLQANAGTTGSATIIAIVVIIAIIIVVFVIVKMNKKPPCCKPGDQACPPGQPPCPAKPGVVATAVKATPEGAAASVATSKK